MISARLAAELPCTHFRAVVFSPQTYVWPPNPHIPYLSYKKMVASAKKGNKDLEADLKEFGTAPLIDGHANLCWLVMYGNRNRFDAKAIHSLGKGRVMLEPLPMSSHSTILPFLCNANDPTRVQRLVAELTSKADQDGDIAFDVASASNSKLFNEIINMLPRPDLRDLIIWLRNLDEATANRLSVQKPTSAT